VPEREKGTKVGISRDNRSAFDRRECEQLLVVCGLQTTSPHVHSVVAGLLEEFGHAGR